MDKTSQGKLARPINQAGPDRPNAIFFREGYVSRSGDCPLEASRLGYSLARP
jgi:hypothetical protein